MTTLTVWATTDTERSLRTAAAGIGTSVGLQQGRNETRTIQVLAKTDGAVTNFDITASSLRSGMHTIAASNLRVHRAKQIQVIQATTRNASDPEVGDEGTLGWYPDALIPVDHPVTGDPLPLGKTFQALPYTLQANQTHTFWVDVSVPKGTAARDYTGTLTITADGQSDVTISITLQVWPFTLPDTARLLTDYGRPDTAMRRFRSGTAEPLLPWPVLTDDQWDDVSDVCNTLWSKSRLSAQTRDIDDGWFLPNDAGGGNWNPPDADEIAIMQTHIDTYHPSVYSVADGARLVAGIGVYDSDELDAYLTAQISGITSVGRPDTVYTNFLADEPWDSADTAFVNRWGPQVHDSSIECFVATPVLRVHGEDDDMIGAPNIWGMSLKDWTVAEKAEHSDPGVVGDTFWFYVGLWGTTAAGARPYYALDRNILNYRMQPWIAWHEGVSGLHYSGSGIGGVWNILRGASDPWTEPFSIMRTEGTGTVSVSNGSDQVTFTASEATVNGQIDKYISIRNAAGKDAIYRISSITGIPAVGTLAENYQGSNGSGLTFHYQGVNGDFVLAYPCSEADVGYYGMVPSMRLKALRDGIQDYDYFSLANDLGLRDSVDEIVDALIISIEDGSWDWTRTGAGYESGRRSLGALIAAASQRPEVSVAGEIFKHGIEPHDETFKQGSVTNMARITGSDGQILVRSQFDLGTSSSSSSGVDARANYTIYLLNDQDSDDRTPVTGHENIAVDIATVLFNTLQTDDRWTEDDTGYNFRHVLDVSGDEAFAVAGRNYLVEYRLVPTGGQVILIRFRFNVI